MNVVRFASQELVGCGGKEQCMEDLQPGWCMCPVNPVVCATSEGIATFAIFHNQKFEKWA